MTGSGGNFRGQKVDLSRKELDFTSKKKAFNEDKISNSTFVCDKYLGIGTVISQNKIGVSKIMSWPTDTVESSRFCGFDLNSWISAAKKLELSINNGACPLSD